MRGKLHKLYWILIDIGAILLLYLSCLYICRVHQVMGFATFQEALATPLCWGSLFLLLPLVMLTMIYTGVYRNLWQYSQPLEYFRMVLTLFCVGVVWFGLNRGIFKSFGYVLPFYFYMLLVSVLVIYFSCSRFVLRWLYDFVFKRHKRKTVTGRATLIVGAGSACTTMLTEIHNTEQCGIRPVVAVDADPVKHGRSICGIPIAGDASMIPALCEKYKIDLIIIAIPSATNRRRAELIRECAKTGLEVKTLPRVHDFEKEDRSFLQKLRDITPDELLGREPIVLDNPTVAAFTRNKTVLVTGGGGSIGSELCRQIAATKPRKLIIVDIYENNAYDIQQELVRTYGDELNLSVIIASVRDYDRLLHIFLTEKPDLCIHAAAHKHVPLMEVSPGEAVKNNIFGTLNMAKAAVEAKVSKVILISTDKAVNPTNVMGATKRVCEMIVQSMNNETTAFSAVRFGNVLGSNGSVIPLFKKQIEQGGPVTVTHPEIIRYFMTIPEAVQLVLTAGALAKGGETFVLDMGQPVKIMDLAQMMIDLTGRRDIEIKITGLRPGEKLYEELLMSEEGLTKTENDKIYIGKTTPIDHAELASGLERLRTIVTASSDSMAKEIVGMLSEMVPTFHHRP